MFASIAADVLVSGREEPARSAHAFKLLNQAQDDLDPCIIDPTLSAQILDTLERSDACAVLLGGLRNPNVSSGARRIPVQDHSF